MEQNRVIETIGSITKMEHLHSLTENTINNTMVLFNAIPFPGVTNQSEEKIKELGSHFIILRYRYAPEKINKINHSLFKEHKLKRYPSYGEIITRETIYPCIRLKENQQEDIIAIQTFLKQHDLKLMTFKHFDQVGRIKIFKTFKLIEISDGLYRDLSEGEKFYIQISDALNWKRFNFINKKIKSKLDNKNFDAAMGVIYRFSGPQNVIRVYDCDKSLERAMKLKKMFLTEVKKEIHITTLH